MDEGNPWISITLLFLLEEIRSGGKEEKWDVFTNLILKYVIYNIFLYCKMIRNPNKMSG